MEKIGYEILERMSRLEKAFSRQQRENKQESEKEAKQLLAQHLDVIQANYNDSSEDIDEPRELDKDDPKDRKIMTIMSKMIDHLINKLTPDDEDESSSGSEEEGDTEEENIDDGDEEFEPDVNRKFKRESLKGSDDFIRND